MKTIKIKFSGMTGNFNPKDNFIVNILKKYYTVELVDNPDYLIYSVRSKDYLKYNCIRIYFTPENLAPDFNICDYAIGFSNIVFDDRYIRMPLYLVDSFVAYKNDDYNSDLQFALEKHLNVNKYISQKKEFCSFVYSNAQGAPCREKIMEELSTYKRVDSGGKYKNNIGRPVENKREFQTSHKFVIAFENTSTKGYTTEKIIGAYAAGAIPIYWGDPDIEKTFNIKSFINCNEYGLDAAGTNKLAINTILKKIKEIDQSEELYKSYLSEPAFINCQYPQNKKAELERFLINIFNQEKEQAFRRNRYYWGERYERKQRIGNEAYWAMRKLIPVRDSLRNIGFGKSKYEKK